MHRPLFRGIGVALVTMFDSGCAVDVDATAKHAAQLVDLGVGAVLVAGSTGEAEALTDDERVALIRTVRAACPGVPLLAGASGDWWRLSVQRIEAAMSAGADAVLVAPPRRCTDIIDFYCRIAAAVDGVPVLAYHYPPVAGGEVPVEELETLPVSGIKDSSGSAERLLRELDVWRAPTYVGSFALVSYAGAVGAAGAILALANAVPELCRAAWEGDAGAQRGLLKAHVTTKARFPFGLKSLMAHRFGTPLHSRLG